MAPLLLETAKSHGKIGIQGDVSDRARAQIASTEEEKRWTTTRKDRVELALPSSLEKEESDETRETGARSRKVERRRKLLKKFSQASSKIFIQFLRTKKDVTQSERPHWVERTLEKLENGLCWWIADFTKETERALNKLKTGRDNWTRSLKALPLECLEKLTRSLSVMCWDMSFPGSQVPG